MSDTEEVVLPRSNKSQLKVNTKPEIAREKLKEKRERLKKEKENMLIEEAKKRLALDAEKKAQEEVALKQQEEEKKKSDPSYALLMKMEQMMKMMSENHAPVAPGPLDDFRGSGKVAKAKAKKMQSSKVEDVPSRTVEDDDEEPEVQEKPKRKPRVPKEPKKIENVPKRKKKIVYLQQEPVDTETNQFVGYDIAPPAQPIQYTPSSGLLNALMGRRNMNSFQ
jgi:hypothetical protein